MNQRLLERLQRHGAFPQARPDANGAARSDSVRPFGIDRPRLALSQQPSSAAQPRLISQAPIPQPLESAMAFANSPTVASAQLELASSMVGADRGEIQDVTRTEDQAEVAALEDIIGVTDRSDFSEIPFSPSNFSLTAQTADPINANAINADLVKTETISADPINAAPTNTGATVTSPRQAQATASFETKASRSASQSAARAPNQLEPTTEEVNVLAQSSAPRIVGAQSVAQRIQPNSPTAQVPTLQVLTAQAPTAQTQTPIAQSNALESQLNGLGVTEDTIAKSEDAILELSETLASQETAGLAVVTVDQVDSLGLPPASGLDEAALQIQAPLRAESAAEVQLLRTLQADPLTERQPLESRSPDALPAQPNPGFDRKAAMLELSALGLKVRVTLSNAAMKTQLEVARAAARRTADAPTDISASGALNRITEIAVQPNTLEAVAPPAQIAATPREDANEWRVDEASFEARDAPFDLPASVQTRGERDSSAASSLPTATTAPINSLEAGLIREVIARNLTEIPAYGAVVAAVEVYNPPNRRATVTRPRAEEAPKNQAETLFSTLPESNPLEWLSRLGSVGAVDVAAPNPSQSLIAPERNALRIGAAQIDPALMNLGLTDSAQTDDAQTDNTQTDNTQTDTTQTNAALTDPARVSSPQSSAGNTPPLSTPNTARRPLVAPQSQAAKLIAAVAPRVEPASSRLAAASVPASAQRVAPRGLEGPAVSVSGSPSAPAPSAVQRQGVSSDAAIPTSLRASTPQGGRPESAVLAARLETQPSGEALERDANQSNLDQRNVDQRNLDQRNLDQRNPLEVTTAEITVAGNLAALEQRLRLPADESRFSSRTESEETGRSEVAKTERSEVTDIERNQAENVERSEVKDVNRSEAKNIVRSEVKNTERSEAKNTERSRAEDSGQSPESRDSAPTSTATSSDALPNAPVLRTAVLDASTSSDPISSDPTRNPAGLVAQATGVARTAQPGLDAAGETESVTGQASRLPPSRADFAPQGTPSAVEVYNPPNRRAAITRPKAEEAPKSEAETLFSTLPDSEPLEWLSRLGSIGAVELDSSSPRVAPALVPVGTAPVGTARSVDPLGAALRAVSPTGEPGPRTASDLSTAPNPSTAPNLNPARFAANSAPTGNALPISSARALEAQRRGSQPLQSEISNPDSASSAGRLAANSEPEMQSNQIGSGSRVAPLVAAPANAAPSQLIATPPSEAMTRGAAPPVRLSMSAQRLIAPITGVDPNSVEIRRDPQSDALTRSYRADALTVDGTVLLSARMVAETPETLGVIAHELTHVARARQPRFVPPALRQPQSLAPDSATRPMTPSLEGLGEEGIALQVEGMTRALAQRGAAQGSRQLSGSSAASGAITPRTSESTPWSDGVLPAPWELMDRLEALTNPGLSAARNQNLHQNPQAGVQPAASQSQQPVRYASPLAVRSEAVAFAGAAVNQSVSSPSSSVAGSGLGGIGGVAAPRNVQAAEQSRSVPTPSPAGPLPKSPPATQKPVGGASPAPDLDDLARQVYAVLKRRLITERRRSS